MTKGDKMVWSYLHWKKWNDQFHRKHCIKVTKCGLTLSFRKPSNDPEKVAEAEAYLKNVIEILHQQARKHVQDVLTTGYGVMEV
jgi:hypothetical protein